MLRQLLLMWLPCRQPGSSLRHIQVSENRDSRQLAGCAGGGRLCCPLSSATYS